MNENYSHPEMPKDKNCEEGILKGMYKIRDFNKNKKNKNSISWIRIYFKRNDKRSRNFTK
jgi:pyruvate dehydrogenase complex dehydrogenase (E1) component